MVKAPLNKAQTVYNNYLSFVVENTRRSDSVYYKDYTRQSSIYNESFFRIFHSLLTGPTGDCPAV